MRPIAPQAAAISEWFAAQYRAAVGLSALEGGERFKRLAAAFPAASRDPALAYPLTSRQRVMSTFLHLNFRFPLSRSGYAWLALTAAGRGGEPAIFALAFWRRPPAEGKAGAAREPEYIALSPTFESRDGEYRPRLLCYPAFSAACQRFAPLLALFEERVIALAERGALKLSARAHDPGLLALAEELRLAPLCLAAALALDLPLAACGSLPAHTRASYVRLLRVVAEEAPLLAEEARRAEREHGVLSSYFSRGVQDILALHAGVKLVPMSLKDITCVQDANFAAWRELAAAQGATDLVINFVTPGAPIHGGWEYLEGAAAGPYENPSMAERFARSTSAADAVALLRKARAQFGAIRPSTYHTGAVSARVLKSIEYAQGFLLMSPVSMLHVQENVGWSLASHGAVSRRVLWPNDLVGVGAFADPDHAARLLFGLAFTAHCFHTKLGLAHTDLHCNNITYFRWGLQAPPQGGAAPYYADPLVAFVAGPRGEADTFLFPAAGDGCFIIDFSRCILGTAFAPRLGAAPAAAFYRNQTNRALRTIERYAPDYARKHQSALKGALLARFDAAFEVLCLVDFIALGANVGGTLRAMAAEEEKGDLRRFEVAPRALELAAQLEEAAREALILGLGGLVAGAAELDGARAAGRPAPPEAPGLALLRRVFGDWQFARWAARSPERLARAQLVDAFNYNNELKSSCRSYERFPPWARLEAIAEHLGPLKLSEIFERGADAFLGSLGASPRVEVVAAAARAEQEKLDGPPVPTSSWLED